jgi:hypothetical protein
MLDRARILGAIACVAMTGLGQEATAPSSSELAAPVRLAAADSPIDIGKLSKFAHAGPWIADVNCDGKRDLVVGDFPGHFWVFENSGNDKKPVYKAGRKLAAASGDAKVPVY